MSNQEDDKMMENNASLNTTLSLGTLVISANTTRQESLRRKFCKDYSLPITILANPHFEYLLELYDDYLGCNEQWREMNEIIKKDFRSSEGLFSMLANDVIYYLLGTIEKSESFVKYNTIAVPEELWINRYLKYYPDVQGLDSKTLNQYFPALNNCQEVYSGEHDGFYFLSVDMASANFNILRFIDSNIVLGCKTYKDLIRLALKEKLENGNYETSHKLDTKQLLEELENNQSLVYKYLIDAKYLRQVLFGKLNPKRQQSIQKLVMRSLIKILVERAQQSDDLILKRYITPERFSSCTSDEIVIKITDKFDKKKTEEPLSKQTQLEHTNYLLQKVREIINDSPYLSQLTFRCEGFHLKQIKSTKLGGKSVGFVKEFITDEQVNGKSNSEHRASLNVEFKAVTNYLFPQVYKHYFNRDIVTQDLKFLHDGQFVATMDEPIF